MRQFRFVFAFVSLIAIPLNVTGADAPFRYSEGRDGKAELKYINQLPVLMVAGTPEEIGQQIGTLTRQPLERLLTFPKGYIKSFGYESAWPALVQVSKSMVPQFPSDHLKELDALAKQAGIDREQAIVGNTFADIKKVAGCSTLIVEADRSATGGLLFGRNLDYPTLGFLQDYTLVTVYRPNGKHAFVSIGFPGMIGCLSGMNEKGLALAVLEVNETKDDSPKFDPRGTPYAMCFRRLLEECSTVKEAENSLRSMKRTTRINLAICDPKGGAVFEITPKQVVVRSADSGICPCTNHFRTADLATSTLCKRYSALEKCSTLTKIDLETVGKLLNEASQPTTLQTMIFELATLKLHLAIGPCPTSVLQPRVLELSPLFRARD